MVQIVRLSAILNQLKLILASGQFIFKKFSWHFDAFMLLCG